MLAVLLAVLAVSRCPALIRPPEPAGLAVLVGSAATYGRTLLDGRHAARRGRRAPRKSGAAGKSR
ncbi:hypothetical protein [Embleya sp. NPDC050493]|uniref:hypothetical protein n=1 Tax=Embleya sp. NPDC050493 TaxID=3363989 RepID=UPI0037A725A1